MKLYYGADSLVIEPKYNYGKSTNDYGLGFYLTPDKDLARLWAAKNPNGGYLITYDVDIKKLKILHLNNYSEDDVLKWITILVSHRFSREQKENSRETITWLVNNYLIDYNDIDLIIGYRADDSYFDYSREFVNNNLSLEILSKAMVLGKLGIQYVLKSPKAFECIKYLDSEKIEHTDEYDIFRKKIRNEYLQLKSEDKITNTFIRDIIRKKI